MHTTATTIRSTALALAVLLGSPSAFAQDRGGSASAIAETQELREQLTHPFARWGALRHVAYWSYIAKHTFSHGDHTQEVFLYYRDSDHDGFGGNPRPNSFDLYAVYQSGKGKWTIENIYSAGGWSYRRLIEKEQGHVDVELVGEQLRGPDGKPRFVIKPNVLRIQLSDGELRVTPAPSKVSDK